MASLGLFLQCVTSVAFSILMERMVACVGARVLYMSSLALLALSTAVMTFSKNVILVTAMAAVTGYTFCTLQILPYTLTCLYHSDMQVSCREVKSTHAEMKFYMHLFFFFFFLVTHFSPI